MPGQDESQQSAELRLAFLRHLPKRLEVVRRRGRRLSTGGWDINTLCLIFREVQILAGACGRYGLLDLGEQLFALETMLAPCIEEFAVPDAEQLAEFAQRIEKLGPLLERHGMGGGPTPAREGYATVSGGGITAEGIATLVIPPPEFVQRYAKSPTLTYAEAANDAAIASAAPARGTAAAPEATATTVLPKGAAPAPLAAAPSRAAGARDGRRIYHLSDGTPLAVELDQRLEAQGFTLEILDNTAELTEVMRALTPNVVIVDAAFLDDVEAIGPTVRALRGRSTQRVALMVLSEQGDVGTRLRAMRAGADSFIPLPASASDVLARLVELLDAEAAEPFRVMIIEDDRSQALFAESILKKAGMQTCAVMDPLSAIESLDTFQPELILMDLYMPNCDGMELTALIRERDQFVNTPIVFLSGEHDTDKRFDALNAGGDDYLEKPIRPKYLISAVTNRVRRARAMNRRVQAQNPRDAASGLYDRAFVIDKISEALSGDVPHTNLGGVLFVIIDGAQAIRERIGLSVFDNLLAQAGALIAGSIAGTDIAARYGDTSYLVLASGRGEQELLRFAEDVRARFEKQVFEVGDKSLTLAVCIGIATFALEWPDAGSMLNAAERACALARGASDRKVRVFETHVSHADADESEALLVEIREALKYDKFQVLFQPIASLRGTIEEQFEVLLRLRGDGGRMYTAAAIVPLAEKAGMINGVDRWVLSRCLMVIQERQRHDRPVRLFVNQSIDGMLDPQRVSWLRQQLELRRVSGEHVVLKFKFADVLARLRQASTFCEEARALGVMIALSGFEATMASYQLLQHVPLDFLVLSPKYIGAEGQSQKLRQELRQLIQFAKERNLRIVAPLVEEAQTAAALWSAGVDFIQGNFVQQATPDLEFDFRASAI